MQPHIGDFTNSSILNFVNFLVICPPEFQIPKQISMQTEGSFHFRNLLDIFNLYFRCFNMAYFVIIFPWNHTKDWSWLPQDWYIIRLWLAHFLVRRPSSKCLYYWKHKEGDNEYTSHVHGFFVKLTLVNLLPLLY